MSLQVHLYMGEFFYLKPKWSSKSGPLFNIFTEKKQIIVRGKY